MRQVEYKFPIEVLVGNIFKLFHILHESGTVKSAKESLQMVLFFISLYKDGLITNLSSYDPDAINQFQGLIDKLADGKLNNYDYQQVAQILRTELSRLSKTSYSRIASVLNDLDFVVLKENFPVVFDDIVYRFSRSEGRYAGEFIQPVELTRLMCGLSEVKQGAKVYNPFAGLASFGVYLDNGHNYFGQELNQKTWALGTLRLMAYKKSDEFKYVCNDSIAQWPDGSEKFDLIISNTPIGLKLGSQYEII